MRMSLSQPSIHLVFLIPLDKAAKAWLHTLELCGQPVPYYLPPDLAQHVVNEFTEDGGFLTPH
jgi:hypothetical protein